MVTAHMLPDEVEAVVIELAKGGALGGPPGVTPEPILRYFVFMHLLKAPNGATLAAVSEQFARLALGIMALPRSAERTTALRKLLESKDAAVRSALPPL